MVKIGDRITDKWLIFLTFVGQEPIYKYWRDFKVLWWDQETPDRGYDYRVPNWWYNRLGDEIWL